MMLPYTRGFVILNSIFQFDDDYIVLYIKRLYTKNTFEAQNGMVIALTQTVDV